MRSETVAWRAGIASLLEASAEKPGNVTPTKSFKDLSYDDYVSASMLIQGPLLEAASAGSRLKRKGHFSDPRLGKHILNTANSVYQLLGKRNPNLGIILMYAPLAIAAGHMKKHSELRTNLHKVLSHSTPEDTVNIFKAIRKIQPGGMSPKNVSVEDRAFLEEFDLTKPGVFNRIRQKGVTPIDIFKFSAEYDMLASEWISNYKISFTYLDVFKKNLRRFGLSDAIVYTYLQLLSKHPDTYIARKLGNKAAEEVSMRAQKLLKGYPKGIESFDKYLRDNRNARNPGTTADLIATILFLWLLEK